MTSNRTRHALLMSIMSILVCIAMLIGSTFAWFTDTAETNVNTIKAGTLDIDLEMKNPSYDSNGEGDAKKEWISAVGKQLEFQKAADGSGQTILWEPGATYTLPELRVINNGNLAVKYKIAITGIQGSAKLNEVITWTYTSTNEGANSAAYDINTEHYLAGKSDDSDVIADSFIIKGKMSETAGNDYQNLSITGIGITVVATQLGGNNELAEYDSNDRKYDEDAQYPAFAVRDVKVEDVTDEDGVVTGAKVKEAVEVATTETVSTSDSTAPVAKAAISADTILEAGRTQVALSVAETNKNTSETVKQIVAEATDKVSKSFEIKLDGISKDNTTPVTVEFFTETGLKNVVVYHKGTEMSNDSNDAEHYTYDRNTGKVTIVSKTFSPFDLVYEEPEKVSTFAEFMTALDNAASGDTIKLTGTINPTKNFTFDKSIIIDMNGYGFVRGAEASGGYSIKVNQNCDLTMKNGTWTIDASAGFGKITIEQADTYSNYTENAVNNIVFENVNFINNKPVTAGGNSSNGIEDVVKASMCWGMTVNAKFTNCTFKNAKVTFSAMSKNNNNNTFNATFEGCRFDNLGNTASIEDDCIKDYVSDNCSITVKNCEFNIASTSGVSVVSGRQKAVALTFIDNTVNGSLADSSKYKVTSWANLKVYNSSFKSVMYENNTLTGIATET